MDQSLIERRLNPRVPADAVARVTLRPGCVVAVIDWSTGGALVQCATPLRPGARVHLRVVLPHRTVCVAAQVLRCTVWSLEPPGSVTYRGAVRFEESCDLAAETLVEDDAAAGSGDRLSGQSPGGGSGVGPEAVRQAVHRSLADTPSLRRRPSVAASGGVSAGPAAFGGILAPLSPRRGGSARFAGGGRRVE